MYLSIYHVQFGHTYKVIKKKVQQKNNLWSMHLFFGSKNFNRFHLSSNKIIAYQPYIKTSLNEW